MHELSIAQALVEQVEGVRLANGGAQVVSVELRIGTWRLVVHESLDLYYRTLTRGTALEGSRLEIETVQAQGRCPRCEEVFAVEAPLIVCPVCGGVGGDLLAGQELDLISVELED